MGPTHDASFSPPPTRQYAYGRFILRYLVCEADLGAAAKCQLRYVLPIYGGIVQEVRRASVHQTRFTLGCIGWNVSSCLRVYKWRNYSGNNPLHLRGHS